MTRTQKRWRMQQWRAMVQQQTKCIRDNHARRLLEEIGKSTDQLSMKKKTPKGDETNPDIYCRRMPQEIDRKGAESMFAGTPVLRLVRLIVSHACAADKQGRHVRFLDVRRAYLHADAIREVSVLTPHLIRTRPCWQTEKCTCGTLFAATGWRQSLAQRPRHHDDWHGNVFVIVGLGQDLDCFYTTIDHKLEMSKRRLSEDGDRT